MGKQPASLMHLTELNMALHSEIQSQNSDISDHICLNTSHTVQHIPVSLRILTNGWRPCRNMSLSPESQKTQAESSLPTEKLWKPDFMPLSSVNEASGEVIHKDDVLSLPIQAPCKPSPGLLISCVKTTHEVTPAQSLIGSMGQQLFICTSAFTWRAEMKICPLPGKSHKLVLCHC